MPRTVSTKLSESTLAALRAFVAETEHLPEDSVVRAKIRTFGSGDGNLIVKLHAAEPERDW